MRYFKVCANLLFANIYPMLAGFRMLFKTFLNAVKPINKNIIH
jgi:hypothetical protein